MRRDLSRRQVYMAEEASLAGTAFVRAPGEAVLRDALGEMFVTPWWQQVVGVTPSVTFATNQGSGWYRHGEQRIHLGRTARWLVAAHEVAHMAAAHAPRQSSDAPAHGPDFCGWEVAVFHAAFGRQAAELLHAAFVSWAIAVELPMSSTPLPQPAIWRHYTDSIERGGWQPAGLLTSQASNERRPTIALR